MIRIHASCVAIGGRALLIEGPSGSGKSDLALRLIDRGAVLISDDYTELHPGSAGPVAHAPATIAGLIEVRGIGIVPYRAGPPCPVALVVRAGTPERMPPAATSAMAGVELPMIVLPLLEASAPLKVELALAALP